jgi:hypothetical protein
VEDASLLITAARSSSSSAAMHGVGKRERWLAMLLRAAKMR